MGNELAKSGPILIKNLLIKWGASFGSHSIPLDGSITLRVVLLFLSLPQSEFTSLQKTLGFPSNLCRWLEKYSFLHLLKLVLNIFLMFLACSIKVSFLVLFPILNNLYILIDKSVISPVYHLGLSLDVRYSL